jgi:hypothetical protein
VWTTGFLQCCISCPRSDRQRRCIHPAPWGRSLAGRRRSSVGGSIRTSRRGSGSSASAKEFRAGIRQLRSASGSAPDQATSDAADNARNQRSRPAPGRVVGARRARSTAVHPVRGERCRRRERLCRKFPEYTGRASGTGTDLPCQRIELLCGTQFAPHPQLAFANHVHELDTGKGRNG